ncbi:hypothetical protein DFJ73DRAFT_864641 [Zopfochytrium polystomum]|nr:hypothetical protein DFJ73DRAFT_864641 [Zopfochytrium polystomum]
MPEGETNAADAANASNNNSESSNKYRRHPPVIAVTLLIVWSIAIARFPAERPDPASLPPDQNPNSPDQLRKFAIMDLTSCCIAILLYLLDREQRWLYANFLQLTYFMTSSALGWFWFSEATGYNIVQYMDAFGPSGWLSLPPLLYRVAYFLLWFYSVPICIVVAASAIIPIAFVTLTGLALCFPCIPSPIRPKRDPSTTPRVLSDDDRRKMRTRLARRDTAASSITLKASFVPVAGKIFGTAVGWFAIPVPTWRLTGSAAAATAPDTTTDIELGEPSPFIDLASTTDPQPPTSSAQPGEPSSSAPDAAPAAEDHDTTGMNNGGDGDLTCPVCCDAFADGDEPVVDLEVCAHRFHKKCIAAWFDSGKALCPMCRAVVVVQLVNKKKGRKGAK